jgi:hypothetical protein
MREASTIRTVAMNIARGTSPWPAKCKQGGIADAENRPFQPPARRRLFLLTRGAQ